MGRLELWVGRSTDHLSFLECQLQYSTNCLFSTLLYCKHLEKSLPYGGRGLANKYFLSQEIHQGLEFLWRVGEMSPPYCWFTCHIAWGSRGGVRIISEVFSDGIVTILCGPRCEELGEDVCKGSLYSTGPQLELEPCPWTQLFKDQVHCVLYPSFWEEFF